MNKEEKAVIDFLKVSAITKIEKTILSKEDVKYLLNYIDKLQNELKLKDKVIDNLYADIEYEYSGTGYLKSLEEYYKESDTDE